MEHLIVMNYCTSSIDIYPIDSECDITEDKLKELGYNTDEISYMFTENYSINVNNEIIK